MKFCLTGQFGNLGKLQQLVVTTGHTVTSAVTFKTDYLVVGRDPADKKVQRAKTWFTHVTILNESELIEMLAEKPISEWIKVENRLPWPENYQHSISMSKDVLFYSDGLGVVRGHVFYIYGKFDSLCIDGSVRETSSITHWMPLPKGPT